MIKAYKLSCTLLFFIFTIQMHAQVKTKLITLNKANLPPELAAKQHEGMIKNAVQWNDRNGINMVITSETGIYQNENEGGGAAALYAWHYIVKDGTATLTWKVNDFIKDCPVDIEANYIPNTFAVTDLNKNGFSEVWLMYVTVCHGDVSPLDMKIIMYEDKQKFAMRGQNRIKFSPTEYTGGAYKSDQAFNEGPAVFRDYAGKLWKKHISGK